MTDGVWQAVARSADLGRAPLRVWYAGKPVVLFRAQGGLSALHDRCPHRHVALSGGRVVAGRLECPYHGWQFDGAGRCTDIPGCLTELPRVRVPNYAVHEAEGGIFLSTAAGLRAPYVHVLQGQTPVTRVVRSDTRGRLVDAAENILDATHTHFTHKGLLRGLSARRTSVQVEVTSGPDWVEASYVGEARQDGLISRLLDGARVRTVGRYRHPGIAELEYWGPRGIVLATTFHLRQATPERVEGIGWLTGPRQGGLGQIKALFFKPLFNVALAQDRRVLAASFDNAAGAAPLIGPLDFLRADIEAIVAGRAPNPAPRRFQMSL